VLRHVRIEREGEIAVVRIDRPPANAMDVELLEDGHAALAELEAGDPAAVVLTGRDGFFSAGADLKVAPTLDAAGQREMVAGINRLFAGWYGLPRPLVCAVNGHAIAGGLILALCGDRRIGATEGKLGLTELRAGLPYPAVAMAVVRAELTPAAARRLVLEAELVDPPAALELDLVDELRPPEEVLPRALEVASDLARLPAVAYRRIKEQLRGETIARAREIVERGADPLLGGWVPEETGAAGASILEQRVE
jgi:enoyl-CoA hydratase